ncbi:MAG: hypothetical protein QM767_22545 [Anaeromyxobacter sp.]
MNGIRERARRRSLSFDSAPAERALRSGRTGANDDRCLIEKVALAANAPAR